MTNRDFLNYVKHNPYYTFDKGYLGKFWKLKGKRLYIDHLDGYYSIYHVDYFKSNKEFKYWVNETKAIEHAPEEFI